MSASDPLWHWPSGHTPPGRTPRDGIASRLPDAGFGSEPGSTGADPVCAAAPASAPEPPQAQAEVDAEATGLDLARLLIRDPQRTVLLRVCGDSMQGAGIQHGDLLVVERTAALTPGDGAGTIVVVRLGGCFTVKRLRWRRDRPWLEAAHPAYPPLDLERAARREGLMAGDVEIWGRAVHVIRSLPRTPAG
ncbi:MAG: LexA family protein [Cyanobium sp.]